MLLMETWDAIRARRNVRTFTAQPIASHDLDRILEAGRRAPRPAIAAADLGLGTGHAAAEDQDLARDVLSLPDDRFLAYILSVGYPADRPLRVIERPNRRPFEEVVHRDRW
jgi:nitroreductase